MYQKDSETGSYQGAVGTYPGNGFMINLADNRADSLAIIEDLRKNKWLDEKTRSLIIDLTVYNGNVNLFNQIR
jgi:hypothetical protein